jgi:hypothetical protein
MSPENERICKQKVGGQFNLRSIAIVTVAQRHSSLHSSLCHQYLTKPILVRIDYDKVSPLSTKHNNRRRNVIKQT